MQKFMSGTDLERMPTLIDGDRSSESLSNARDTTAAGNSSLRMQ